MKKTNKQKKLRLRRNKTGAKQLVAVLPPKTCAVLIIPLLMMLTPGEQLCCGYIRVSESNKEASR